jgi:hypothetical protein
MKISLSKLISSIDDFYNKSLLEYSLKKSAQAIDDRSKQILADYDRNL